MPDKKIMIVAGEASGDQRGAEVAVELLKLDPTLSLFGIGGKEMRAASVDTVADVEQLAVMGFIEPLKHLPRILKIFKQMKNLLATEKPDLLILVDYPGFNLRLAKVAKSLGIKVLFYISPQVWAWRQNRVKKIAKVVDHMAVLFPFEEKFYQAHHVPVTYVGHPLTQKIKNAPSQTEARQQLTIADNQVVITLMPGSRHSEVEKLLPLMLQSAQQIAEQKANCQFVLALASTINRANIETQLNNFKLDVMISDNSIIAVTAADAVITASGTATLETALLNKPMVIVYKVNKLSAAIAKRVIKIPHISLCNIVAEKGVVKEFLQENATADNITNEILQIINNESYHHTMLNDLKAINTKLGDMQAAENVARLAESMLKTQ
jgi:lipid-A-disaccharide synthase